MKKLLLLIPALSCFVSNAQWAYTPNNTSNDVTTAFGNVLASDGLVSGTNGLYASTDNGTTWASSNTGVPSSGLIFGTLNSGSLYAFRSNSVYVSTTGNNWSMQTSSMSSSLTIKSMTSLSGSVIASASPNSPVSFKIFQLNAGSWSLKSSPTNSAIITCIRNLGGTLYAGTTASNVLKSTDAGMTWTGGLSGMPTENCNKYVNCLASSGNTMYCGTIGGKIVRSTDAGATWSTMYNIGDNNGFYGINEFYVHSSSAVFAATDSGFVYTLNGGNTWARYNTGLNFSNFENLMKRVTVSGAYVIAGVNTSSSARVVRLPLSSIGLTTGLNELAVEKFENKVYPNPASENATIEVLGLAFDNQCMVKVFDVVGREVANLPLINGEAKINTQNFTAGLYSFTVTKSNTVVSTGKLIVK